MADGGSGAVRRLSALRESVYGAISGAVYGAAAVATAHPFDTIKTQQQSARGTVARGPLATARAIVHAEGALRGLYRGFAPALSGSVLFRSLPFVGYSASTAYLSERSAAHSGRGVPAAAAGLSRAAAQVDSRRRAASTSGGVSAAQLTLLMAATVRAIDGPKQQPPPAAGSQ